MDVEGVFFREEDEDLEILLFADRSEAGRMLAGKLAAYSGRYDVIVLGLPRGGVPVAAAVASALKLPLDVFVVTKIGTPWQQEVAMGAMAEGGVRVLVLSLIRLLAVSQWYSDFTQVGDDEVQRLLQKAESSMARAA